MDFISEEIIEQVAAKLEARPERYEALFKQFSTEQPAILAYLFSDSFKILLQREREFMLYLGLIIWLSVKEKIGAPAAVTSESLELAEEQNYAQLSAVKAKDFRERLDIFFQAYPQEDLLAFVEDALNEEEETELSKPGREPMFIALKTIIDCLVKS